MLGFEGCAGPALPLTGTVIAGPTLVVHCSMRVALPHVRADEYTQERQSNPSPWNGEEFVPMAWA